MDCALCTFCAHCGDLLISLGRRNFQLNSGKMFHMREPYVFICSIGPSPLSDIFFGGGRKTTIFFPQKYVQQNIIQHSRYQSGLHGLKRVDLKNASQYTSVKFYVRSHVSKKGIFFFRLDANLLDKCTDINTHFLKKSIDRAFVRQNFEHLNTPNIFSPFCVYVFLGSRIFILRVCLLLHLKSIFFVLGSPLRRLRDTKKCFFCRARLILTSPHTHFSYFFWIFQSQFHTPDCNFMACTATHVHFFSGRKFQSVCAHTDYFSRIYSSQLMCKSKSSYRIIRDTRDFTYLPPPTPPTSHSSRCPTPSPQVNSNFWNLGFIVPCSSPLCAYLRARATYPQGTAFWIRGKVPHVTGPHCPPHHYSYLPRPLPPLLPPPWFVGPPPPPVCSPKFASPPWGGKHENATALNP